MKSLCCNILRNLAVFLFLATVLPSNSIGAAAADIAIYGNTLAAGWSDWSWDATSNYSNASPVHSLPSSLAVTFNSGWAGLYLHADTAIDTGGYDQIRFWINGGTPGNQQLRLVFNGDESNAYTVTAPSNGWTQQSVPLSALGSPASLTDIYWQDTTGGAQPTYFLDDITLQAITGPAPPPPPSAGPDLSIDASEGRHPISDGIYGMNYADEQLAAELHLPVRRWGGNSTSRYNWQTSMYNTGSDWYFENIPDGAAAANGSASDRFVDQDRRTGTKTLMTVPLLGWTPKSDSPRAHPYACGFRVAKYGAQQSTDSNWDPECGNGVLTDGKTFVTGNDPSDTSTAVDPSFVTGWINHFTGKYGTAANGGVAYYDLDNEPMLWNSTHRDIHPQPTSYDEMRTATYNYAAAVKAADPSAKTLGPVLWGWCAYFYSAYDNCTPGSDFSSHDNTFFVPWYLQQMKSYEQQHGARILDYLDLHYYPYSVSLSSAGNSSTQALRLRSTRSLWDPTYVDESWIPDIGIDGGVVKLIPRMKYWVNTYYPGTRMAITEYNWGALESINGALAEADVLGIFGREGLDIGTIWGPPTSSQPGAFAFRIYRNYDGAGHGFGDISVQSTSSDQDKLAVYAAQRSTDNALTAVVINKTGSSQTSTLTLSGFTPQAAAGVYRYSPANLGAIEHPADQLLTASGFSTTFPANSITLYVIPSTADDIRTLTIFLTGSGNGTVSSDPGDVVWNGNTGSAGYPEGTGIILTATPLAGSGSAFSNWTGACTGNTNPCSLNISSDTSVYAQFDILSDFAGTPTTGPVPLYVCFTDTSNDNPTSWLWNFGDGGTAGIQNPCHGYKDAGSYSVSLTTPGGGGGNTNKKSNYINASACSNQPVRIEGNVSPFSKIQDALDNSSSGDTIDLHALDFIENPSLTNGRSVTLNGGLGCDYLQTPLFTTLHGDLTVSSGELTLDRIVIQ